MSSTEPKSGSQAPSPLLLQPYGQYVLVKKLAEGGMAEIFLSKLLGADGFERNVVIKRMLSNLSSLPDFVEMFRDEARLAARLSHPNIIQIHELGFVDGCYYICMEYLAGEDFSTTLRQAGKKRQYTPMPITLRVLVDAARGLHFAHDFTNEQGEPLHIVHRDISPSNLYVTYQGQVKVLDFGIAKAASRLVQTRTGVVKGKYIYMAPEQAQGKDVDRRSDVFSLGVSLYESLTNIRPFARENDLAVLNALTQGDFVPPAQMRRDIPPELDAVVLKALSLDSADRYATAADFADALEHGLKGKVPLATHKELAEYLRAQFGDERFSSKTRVPTMATLQGMIAQQNGLPPPGPVVFASSGVFPTVQPAAQRLSAVGLPAVTAAKPLPAETAVQALVQAPQAPRRTGLWVGVAAGVLLLAGGGFLAVRSLSKPAEAVAVVTPTPPVAAPPVEPTPPVAVTPTPPVVTPDPPPTTPETVAPPQTEDSETKDPVPTKDPSKTSKPRLVTLGIGDVERVVAKGRARIASCFDRYKADLPADTGVVRVQLSIASSGKVKATTQGPLASKTVGQCLESQAERLRFPAHRDQEVNVVLPFDYTVKR
ncbi:protein kinase domain-containing protein [Hyalangium versicolor]|uniref:protein kinase domain-containing protein n=1 Tax=Hyalangium versicolor TaxID=2861190 RepID=UPI001CCD6863|nr:protein kinase [Hyalangium versicolor]